jgi:hypothetical protein
MHYERAPASEGSLGAIAAGGALPRTPGFIALVPLPIGMLRTNGERGMPSHPPESVEAAESALGLLPRMALSSAQSKADSTAAEESCIVAVASKG